MWNFLPKWIAKPVKIEFPEFVFPTQTHGGNNWRDFERNDGGLNFNVDAGELNVGNETIAMQFHSSLNWEDFPEELHDDMEKMSDYETFCLHSTFKALQGKRIKVTIEVLQDE